MSHFAQINENNVVIQVIVAEQDVIDTGLFGDPSKWIQTSYNTFGGMHRLGGTPLRKNFAGIGFSYDSTNDCFVPPQPYPSWTLNPSTCLWEPPVPMPTDGKVYDWNETAQIWEANSSMSTQ